MIQKLGIGQIQMGARHRKEMGDLQTLAQSIHTLGLLQPIGVTSKMQLVWGERRLKACQLLGWTQIDAVVDPSLDDIVRAMQAEGDENRCRLPFSHSECVAISDHLQAIERQRAQERQKAVQAKPGDKLRTGDTPSRIGGDKLAPPIAGAKNPQVATAATTTTTTTTDDDRGHECSSPAVPRDPGKTRDKVAAALGMSHGTLSKARKVVAEGTPELIEAMDKGIASVDAAAQVASLPHAKQRNVVAGGKEAITSAATKLSSDRGPRRPGLHRVLERLDAIARLRPSELNLGALREALKDLRKELGPLLS